MSATRKNATPADRLADAIVTASLDRACDLRDRSVTLADIGQSWSAFTPAQMARDEVRVASTAFAIANAYRAERAA